MKLFVLCPQAKLHNEFTALGKTAQRTAGVAQKKSLKN